MGVHENLILYEKKFSITINGPGSPLFYLFDFDERAPAINMEFQHFHPFFEMHILLDERAAHIIEGEYYALDQYDIVLLRPMLLHKTEYPEGPASKRLIINFAFPRDVPGLEPAIEKLLTLFDTQIPIYRFPETIRSALVDRINEIFRTGKNYSDIHALTVHTKFVDFLCALYAARKHNTYVPARLSDSIAHKVYTVTSYIHTHYREKLSLERLSAEFFISPYYLSHQFKKITGFTLVHYVQMTRIRNAQQLLRYTETKISNIAEDCGFTSFSQFNRVFNNFCGVSPSSYRQGKDPVRREIDFE